LVYVSLGRNGPVRAAELVIMLEGRVGRVTVYRTLELFRKLGVASAASDGLIELSAEFSTHHHHFRCTKCGWKLDFLDPGMERAVDRFASGRKFVLEQHQLEFAGVCRRCVEQGAPK
jgi:Fur family ferric uptake transcriptional regulator